MSDTIQKNPFAELVKVDNDGIDKNLIEEVFLFTLTKTKATENHRTTPILQLADVLCDVPVEATKISEEILSHALFERLILTETDQYLLKSPKADANTHRNVAEVVEENAITYLYRAFVVCQTKLKQTTRAVDDCNRIKNLILINAGTCVRQPEIFQGQFLHLQFLTLLTENVDDQMVQEFLTLIALKIAEETDTAEETLGALKTTFYPMLGELQKKISNISFAELSRQIYWIFNCFVADKRAPQLGEVLIDYTTPNPNAKGGDYMETLFGNLFCISILPRTSSGSYEYFSNTNDSQHSDPRLWQLMCDHQNSVFLIIKQLLVLSPTTKSKTLQWIGNCLHANVARGQLWNNINDSLEHMINQNASDAFMLGLTAVLLRLCQPLCEPHFKVLLVDPTYCAVEDDERQEKQVHMIKAYEETCLQPTEENSKRLTATIPYNFITEVFFLTHKAFELSYHVCYQRFIRMARETHNMQQAYQNIANQRPGTDVSNNMLRVLKEKTQQFLCFGNALQEPENDKFILKFFEASAIWLNEIAMMDNEKFEDLSALGSWSLHEQRNRRIAEMTDNFRTPLLNSIPEGIVDNIISYLTFSRYLQPGQYIEIYLSSHDAFFKMIILFMGDANIVKNPHLRAKLAEALEILLPKEISGSPRNSFNSQVFDTHPDRFEIVKSLLNVFVSIEMTGQVQFEQKFNYRRPMYSIMEFLWTKDEYIKCFEDLAKDAEENIEATEPPIFLRFVNLLINDAIFLLDESLSSLQQIRQLQEAQDNGDWDRLNPNERQQQIANLHQIGMMTRFNNILSHDTIKALKLLTTKIKRIFCHDILAHRIAAMLNYFLLNLVGPQKERFKVKNKESFDFDPAQMVMEICNIYINLSESENFCMAVSQDGRSYSDKLFSYAENILIRIGGGQLIGDILEFAKKVKQLDAQYKKDQECLADAPDEYLDPIMSTLMTDPVILPSSKMTVDRSTITRHLLSDQTDPFNRAPLTMDIVKPNYELKAEIERWLSERRANASNTSLDNSDDAVDAAPSNSVS